MPKCPGCGRNSRVPRPVVQPSACPAHGWKRCSATCRPRRSARRVRGRGACPRPRPIRSRPRPLRGVAWEAGRDPHPKAPGKGRQRVSALGVPAADEARACRALSSSWVPLSCQVAISTGEDTESWAARSRARAPRPRGRAGHRVRSTTARTLRCVCHCNSDLQVPARPLQQVRGRPIHESCRGGPDLGQTWTSMAPALAAVWGRGRGLSAFQSKANSQEWGG